jgi:hypothetical protein
MAWKEDPKGVLYQVSIGILVVGLAAASCIYLFVDDSPADLRGSQIVIVDGSTYSIPLNATKLYTRDLARFGGKAAILFDDLSQWFAGLWEGRALASTILWISVIASLALFLTARYLFPDKPHR